MAEQSLPPDPSFSGIDFNPSFFPSATSEYVEFPVAQGTVTFGEIFATDIDTPTPSVDFDLLTSEVGNINFGTSVPTTKTIKIGASTGTSIHCGSIDLQGTNINNAVASDTGTISLGPKQTTGPLYIGSSSSTGVRTTGAINIGTNSVGATPITIGTAGSTTTSLKGLSVDVGTKITTPILNADAVGTAMTIGANITTGSLAIGGVQSGVISLGAGQTSGVLNIGTGTRTSGGDINIGTAAGLSSNVGIYIGTPTNSSTSLYGSNVLVDTKLEVPIIHAKTAATGMTIGANITSGTITIGGTGQQGATNIDTTSNGAHTITIGTAGSTTTSLKGLSVDVGTKITTPILNADAVGTAMTIGANITTGSLAIGGSTQTGDISLGAGQTSGNLNIGTSTSRAASSAINIGTGSTAATVISVGTSTTSTVLNGTSVKATTKLTTPILDCVTDAVAGSTSLAIGGTAVNGNIVIGAALGVGDITIGGAQTAGGTITLGSSATVTTNSGGFTMSGNNKITLSNVYTTIPTATQLGFYTINPTPTATLINSTTPIQISTINNFSGSGSGIDGRGVFLVNVTVNSTAFSGLTTGFLTITYTNVDSAAIIGTPPKIGYSTSQKGTSWSTVITNLSGGGGVLVLAASDVATNSSTLTLTYTTVRIG